MTKSPFRCEAAIAAPTRRAILVGIGAGAPLLALMATHRRGFDPGRSRRAGVLRVEDLVDADGLPTPLALAKAGEMIAIRGFYAPALRGGALFDLYERTVAACLACGLVHDPGPALTVRGDARPIDVSLLRRMEIVGRLEVDARGGPRLTLT
jgi:hypothetical protein